MHTKLLYKKFTLFLVLPCQVPTLVTHFQKPCTVYPTGSEAAKSYQGALSLFSVLFIRQFEYCCLEDAIARYGSGTMWHSRSVVPTATVYRQKTDTNNVIFPLHQWHSTLGNFYCTPWGELNTYLSLNIFKKKEQCIGRTLITRSGSTRSL